MFANDVLGDNLKLIEIFGTSLGIGLLLGLERERSPAAKAGLRTFALTAIMGTFLALLTEEVGGGWLLPAGLIIVGGMTVAAYARGGDEIQDPGTTTVVAICLCYILGAVCWYGYSGVAVPAAIVATSLLYFKAELRGISQKLTRRDIVSILQFGALSFIVLPILPNRNLGPFGAINPYQIWLMVVLISGLSLAGYVALRMVGPRYGAALVGIFGGMVSSTATTLLYARRAQADASIASTGIIVILLANSIVLLRLALMIAFASASLLPAALPMLGIGFVFGLAAAAYSWRRMLRGDEVPIPEVKNPTEMKAALGFGALYALVVVISAWLAETVGSKGVYAFALVSGFTDVDAITLSSLRLFSLGNLEARQAVTAIGIAVLSNIALKCTMVFVVGGRAFGKKAAAGFLATAAGVAIGLALRITV